MTGRRRGFRPARDLPTVLWLVATALATFTHTWLPAPRWLMIHLLLLGAVGHSILVWSRFFAEAVLRTPGDATAWQDRRLALFNGGVLVVVGGVASSRQPLWWLVVLGAVALVSAVLWHAVALLAMLRRALPARFAGTVHYYVSASLLLPVGATLGTILARGLGEEWHTRVEVAHASVNLLGWVGLTVGGTLVTLWPTVLRTRMGEGAERDAARALWVLVAGVAVAAGGSLAGSRTALAVGLAVYLVGLGLIARAVLDAARRRPPRTFAPLSIAAGLCWWTGSVAALAVLALTAHSWADLQRGFAWLTPFLAAGFAAQVLLGALTHLVPVSLGGGPRAVRAAAAELERGAPVRVSTTNAALLVCVLPVPSLVRVLASSLALAALLTWLPLLVRALRASRRAKAEAAVRGASAPREHVEGRPRGQFAAMAAVGLGLVVLAAATGVALDPTASGAGSARAADAGVAATGRTTTVQVVARDMRFHPDRVEVPAGNRLVIELVNDSEDVHDLVLESGETSGRLGAGESATVVVPVVGRSVPGWCSVLGHRQMGMVFSVDVAGSAADDGSAEGDPDTPPTEGAGNGHNHGSHSTADPDAPSAAEDLDPMAPAPAGFEARDARLAPLPPGNRVHRRTFTVRDTPTEVAPGVTQTLWTFDGTAPGPLLHGRVGDRFVITLVNEASVGHSIDFHASEVSPQRAMRTIAPGERLVYRFTARRAGVWMYHCSTMPMSAHIANGLFGAVVIEPPDLPPVDHSYLLVQSELYLGPQGGEADGAKLAAEAPDAVVFNGYVNQYAHDPLTARVGERVRIWVLDAGPNRPTSFHVVGGQFDTVWFEGDFSLRPGSTGGSQALGLQAAQGGFVELAFREPGDYPFVSHLMIDAERGASGLVRVTR